MRNIFWLASAGLILSACGPAQEGTGTEEEPALDTQPELVDPVVDDPVDDPGMMPPEMENGDTGDAMPDDPAMADDEPAMAEESAADDEAETEDPAAPDGDSQ
ncbi:MAG: hypothetical protein AAGE05_06010 [Pseudomonadota bacterium]